MFPSLFPLRSDRLIIHLGSYTFSVCIHIISFNSVLQIYQFLPPKKVVVWSDLGSKKAFLIYPICQGTQSPGTRWCLAKWLACENVLWHFSQLNGFSPVWVRMWLFKVVAPEKEREQNPHLNNFSLVCVSTWLLSSDGVPYESVHWPHWYGLSGVWEHSCIWRRTRWVKVFKHCRHLHIPNSSGDREIPDMFVPKCSWYCGVWRSGGIAGRSAGITLFTPSPFRLRACPSFVRGEFFWSSGKVTVGRFYLKY